MFAPIETQPADVLLDAFDVFVLFLRRIRIVEPHVTAATEVLPDPEVEADRLGMANM